MVENFLAFDTGTETKGGDWNKTEVVTMTHAVVLAWKTHFCVHKCC